MERRVKRSVAVAIGSADRLLIVQRPGDDEDLPNAWGLPAATLRGDEDWPDAVRRAGKEKLGVDLIVGDELNRGEIGRADYALEMRLYEATIAAGEPAVPQRDTSVTQYQDWKWGSRSDLQPAAQAGSLCCRLFLAASPG
jgi:ADP-ribose pyrophosphatase YjhB (NUDIX family)